MAFYLLGSLLSFLIAPTSSAKHACKNGRRTHYEGKKNTFQVRKNILFYLIYMKLELTISYAFSITRKNKERDEYFTVLVISEAWIYPSLCFITEVKENLKDNKLWIILRETQTFDQEKMTKWLIKIYIFDLTFQRLSPLCHLFFILSKMCFSFS